MVPILKYPPGLRIKCIWKYNIDRLGKIATVIDNISTTTNRFVINIKWDDETTYYLQWSFALGNACFELYIPDDMS